MPETYPLSHDGSDLENSTKNKEQTTEEKPEEPIECVGGKIEIPDGWCVTHANFDKEKPTITIQPVDINFGECRTLEVPQSLAYYLRTHYCGSEKMHKRITENAKHSVRVEIQKALGLYKNQQ